MKFFTVNQEEGWIEAIRKMDREEKMK